MKIFLLLIVVIVSVIAIVPGYGSDLRASKSFWFDYDGSKSIEKFKSKSYLDLDGNGVFDHILIAGCDGTVFKTKKIDNPKNLLSSDSIVVDIENVKHNNLYTQKSADDPKHISIWELSDSNGTVVGIEYHTGNKDYGGSNLVYLERVNFAKVKYDSKYLGADLEYTVIYDNEGTIFKEIRLRGSSEVIGLIYKNPKLKSEIRRYIKYYQLTK